MRQLWGTPAFAVLPDIPQYKDVLQVPFSLDVLNQVTIRQALTLLNDEHVERPLRFLAEVFAALLLRV